MSKENTNAEQNGKIIISPAGSLPSITGAHEYFAGTVRVDMLLPVENSPAISGAYVTFEPNARTAWHTHPVGQMLIVTHGTGFVQQWTGEIQHIHQGDIVWFPANIKHWHGASSTTAMTHIAITPNLNNTNVNWLEHVNNEQYPTNNTG